MELIWFVTALGIVVTWLAVPTVVRAVSPVVIKSVVPTMVQAANKASNQQ